MDFDKMLRNSLPDDKENYRIGIKRDVGEKVNMNVDVEKVS